MEYVFGFEGVGLLSAIWILGAAFPIFCIEILRRGEDFHKEICPSNKAIVYFYNSHLYTPFFPACRAGRDGYHIWDDQKHLIRLTVKTYFVYKVSPGEKSFYVDYRHARNKLDLQLEAGHSYFVKVTLGFIFSRLSIVPEQQALSEISSCDRQAVFRF